MIHASLFSGIGGFDLAAESVGWNNLFHCEINEFCLKILNYYWPNAKTHKDITQTDFTVYRNKVNVLTGGFPCQGFSLAGLRLGTDDDRYLWPEYLRAIDEINPNYIIGENVTGILSMEDKSGVYRDVFAKVENRKITRFHEIDYYEAVYTRQAKMLVNSICESLEERGYEVQTFAIPAAAVGAPHRRERVWFVAHRIGFGINGRPQDSNGRPQDSNGTAKNKQKRNCMELQITGLSPFRVASIATGIRSRQGISKRPSKQLNQNDKKRGVENETLTNAYSNGYRGHNKPGQAGQAGQTTDKSESIGNKRKRIRCINWRIGPEGVTPYSKGQRHKRRLPGELRSIPEETEAFQRSFTAGNFAKDQQWQTWPTKSPVCSGNDGIPSELDGITFSQWRKGSIKAAGNAVVPQIPIQIFKAIEQF